ncbi:hypothetical protein [Fusobacterium sp. MFO224]
MYSSNILIENKKWWRCIEKKFINLKKILDVCIKNFDNNFIFTM